MFGSLAGLIGDVAKVVAAPVEIAVDAARVITKPAADLAQEAAKEVKKVVKDVTE